MGSDIVIARGGYHVSHYARLYSRPAGVHSLKPPPPWEQTPPTPWMEGLATWLAVVNGTWRDVAYRSKASRRAVHVWQPSWASALYHENKMPHSLETPSASSWDEKIHGTDLNKGQSPEPSTARASRPTADLQTQRWEQNASRCKPWGLRVVIIAKADSCPYVPDSWQLPSKCDLNVIVQGIMKWRNRWALKSERPEC